MTLVRRVDEDVVFQIAYATVGREIGDALGAQHIDVEERVPGDGARFLSQERHGGISHDFFDWLGQIFAILGLGFLVAALI
ncbi:hypothetical protein [Nocardia sp. NPDC058114]|uniref:hypothetical protein n=1 Tax=Nocardia sp. NPDC058114 TaxID=3346346 RepID=UPI0036DAE952